MSNIFSLLRKKESPNENLLNYMKSVFEQARVEPKPLSLCVIGQFNYEGDEQVERYVSLLKNGKYEECSGIHNTSMLFDLLIILLVVDSSSSKIIVVLDPFELYFDPTLLATIEVEDKTVVEEYVVQKWL